MRMKPVNLFLLCLFITSSVPADAAPVAPGESKLAVYSHGFKVGEITSSYSRRDEGGRELLLYASHTRISADLLVTSYSMEGDEEARIGSEGTRFYRKAWQENGVRHQVDGRLEGGTFRCVSTGAAADRHTFAIPRERYDFTTMDCPELRIKGEGDSMEIRLLDLESCEVVTRHYRWVRSERLTVNGFSDLYRVIEFRDRNRSGTRWILPDTLGVRIARQDGNSPSGSYTVRAVDPAR